MAKKNYSEAEIVEAFTLQRNVLHYTATMTAWLDVAEPTLSVGQQELFEERLEEAKKNIDGWNEEELRMSFISPILMITGLKNTDKYQLFYERVVSHNFNGRALSVKTDFMIATGFMNLYKKPYFHFQEYKPTLNPTGEPMAQLLQAMLIGQAKNDDTKPIYGCEIVGAIWKFVILEGSEYCISRKYDATDRADLLNIIAILRKFKHILETELLD
jgi:hypothetical protein